MPPTIHYEPREMQERDKDSPDQSPAVVFLTLCHLLVTWVLTWHVGPAIVTYFALDRHHLIIASIPWSAGALVAALFLVIKSGLIVLIGFIALLVSSVYSAYFTLSVCFAREKIQWYWRVGVFILIWIPVPLPLEMSFSYLFSY